MVFIPSLVMFKEVAIKRKGLEHHPYGMHWDYTWTHLFQTRSKPKQHRVSQIFCWKQLKEQWLDSIPNLLRRSGWVKNAAWKSAPPNIHLLNVCCLCFAYDTKQRFLNASASTPLFLSHRFFSTFVWPTPIPKKYLLWWRIQVSLPGHCFSSKMENWAQTTFVLLS